MKRGLLLLSLGLLGPMAHADFSAELKGELIKGLQRDLSNRMELPELSFQIQMSALQIEPEPMEALKKAKIKSVEVLGYDAATARRFDGFANFPILVNTTLGTYEFKAKGLVSVVGPVFVSRVPLARDSIAKGEDFQVSKMPWKQLATGVATLKSSEIIGKRISRFVQAGAPIHPSFVDVPFAVNSGDVVDLLVLSGPGVMIQSRATAKEAGHIGDFINLIQPQTQKKLRAVVTGEKKVEVKL